MFTTKDLEQIKAHGLSVEKVNEQIENFRNGFGFLPIDRAAVGGDGILQLDEKGAEYYASEYTSAVAGLQVVKFVPASGAATRMFKELFEYVNTGKTTANIQKLLAGIDRFAFYSVIRDKVAGAEPRAVVQAVLDYGAHLPKGQILFHNYEEGPRTAFEEHLVEGALYAASGEKAVLHFTVSPEHRAGFEALLAKALPKYEKKFGIHYEVSFSCQKSSTDTIAVTPDNEPFREEDGSLLFRPAGHGALLENLNQIDADVIFIKNIDNVTTDRLKAETVRYKKVLAGVLITLQKKIFNYLNILDRGCDSSTLKHIVEFVTGELSCELPADFDTDSEAEKAERLRAVLNRPVRVCGMVRNDGEPGGGPFWVNNSDGTKSLQIAESSQIAPDKLHLMKEATHFNPVDIVCGVRNYKGNKFDLAQYIDPSTGFISNKSKNGRELKAQELPGLWNGSMARWNTVFVEVLPATFSPVKVVTDLLRNQHQ